MTLLLKELFAELRKITTFELTYLAKSFFEKLLWFLLGISGTVWAVYFITLQVMFF